MHLQQFAPPESLKEHVRYFWTLESLDHSATPKVFRTIADGCPGLFFQHPHQEPFRDEAGRQWPRVLLYGQATHHANIYACGPFRAAGVYLHPSALSSVFGLHAAELTDSCLNLELLIAPQHFFPAARLADATSGAQQIQLISSYLQAKISANRRPVDADIEYAVAQIINAKGIISVGQLQHDLRMSERSLQRRFKRHIGVPPKLFASICRFQMSLGQLRTANYDKLSDIAFEHEYADQSHYTRVFKQFAGLSPYQYRKHSPEQVENFMLLRR
jgi:AraC-like DNA-binding protein